MLTLESKKLPFQKNLALASFYMGMYQVMLNLTIVQ